MPAPIKCILFFRRYRGQLQFSALLQLGILFVASILLDGGVMRRLAVITAIAYWFACGIILIRRPGRPRLSDRLFARWGFLFLLIVSVFEAFLFPSMRDY